MSDSLYIDESDETPATSPIDSVASAPGSESPLGRLKETISKKVERSTILLEVPDREGVYLRISPNITQKQMKAWRRNAGDETKKGMDPSQITGAASSYARKYALAGLLALDDGSVDPDAAQKAYQPDHSQAVAYLMEAETIDDLKDRWSKLPKDAQADPAVRKATKDRKEQIGEAK